jgi:hypothetical protein
MLRALIVRLVYAHAIQVPTVAERERASEAIGCKH